MLPEDPNLTTVPLVQLLNAKEMLKKKLKRSEDPNNDRRASQVTNDGSIGSSILEEVEEYETPVVSRGVQSEWTVMIQYALSDNPGVWRPVSDMVQVCKTLSARCNKHSQRLLPDLHTIKLHIALAHASATQAPFWPIS